MGRKQICLTERKYIEEQLEELRLHEADPERSGDPPSVPLIAKVLRRPPKTVYAEIQRNGRRVSGDPEAPFKVMHFRYSAFDADALARSRRASARGLRKPDAVQSQAHALLSDGHSPGQASMTMRQMGVPVSHVWVYRLAHTLIAAGKLTVECCLRRRGRKSRAPRAEVGPCAYDPGRPGLDSRPDAANFRTEPGHFEVDTVVWRGRSGSALVAVDRCTRKTWVCWLRDLSSRGVLEELPRLLGGETVRSITSDNGGEFARWRELSRRLGASWHFCSPGSPKERGTVEQRIGVLRDFFPKSRALVRSDRSRLPDAVQSMNDRPMIVLGGETADAFHWERVEGKGLAA